MEDESRQNKVAMHTSPVMPMLKAGESSAGKKPLMERKRLGDLVVQKTRKSQQKYASVNQSISHSHSRKRSAADNAYGLPIATSKHIFDSSGASPSNNSGSAYAASRRYRASDVAIRSFDSTNE